MMPAHDNRHRSVELECDRFAWDCVASAWAPDLVVPAVPGPAGGEDGAVATDQSEAELNSGSVNDCGRAHAAASAGSGDSQLRTDRERQTLQLTCGRVTQL